MGDLVQFHTEYKLQLMAYSQAGLRALGRIVANPDSAPVKEVFARYADRLAQVMAEGPRRERLPGIAQGWTDAHRPVVADPR